VACGFNQRQAQQGENMGCAWLHHQPHAMKEILPSLYIGTYADAECLVVHPSESKWAVVNCAREIRNISNRHPSQYLKIPLDDTGDLEDNILFQREIHSVIDFIGERLKEGKEVLVHCQMGKSRSCSVLAAYLLHGKTEYNLRDAKQWIIDRYPEAFDGGSLKVYDLALRHALNM